MGTYLNPGNEIFSQMVLGDTYVDKTGLITYMNGRIGKARHLIASSRPRRFGKTLAADMLTAYYSKGCDSENIFRNLEIAKDKSFKEHLNKYDVLSLDIQWMRGIARNRIKEGRADSIVGFIQHEVTKELREAYPEYVDTDETLIAMALNSIYNGTKNQFIIIIDEWDCVFREDKENTALQEEYIQFLRSLFKGAPADKFVKLGYITGILPIKKYGTQSALNNFRELTMTAPNGLAPYIGFTEEEVKILCQQHRASFVKMKKWYDGYIFDQSDDLADDTSFADEDFISSNEDYEFLKTGHQESKTSVSDSIIHVYSPNSVMEALNNRKFQNYWSQTETYEDLKMYIEMNFDGLKQKIVDMLGGGRVKIVTQSFQNDMTSFKSASDVLTLLIHLGYLAYSDQANEVFIPNEEVRDTFVLSIMDGNWADVYNAIQNSERLMCATLAMDETTVAEMIRNVHMENTSSLVYNNEISLASVIQVAYYTAARDYTLIRELPSGEGFADMVFIPKRCSDKPALIVELKWDKSAKGAINQIKEMKYTAALKEYSGNMLLVGINYDKKTKKHQCRIEKYKM